jgi:hypothetical protein
MKVFGDGDQDGGAPTEGVDLAATMAKLDSALTSIFSEDGKKTVLYYLSNKYGLTLEQSSVDPAKLEKALTNLLGVVGWMVVKRGILEQFWDRRIELQEMKVVESASLLDAFGFIRGLGGFGLGGPF